MAKQQPNSDIKDLTKSMQQLIKQVGVLTTELSKTAEKTKAKEEASVKKEADTKAEEERLKLLQAQNEAYEERLKIEQELEKSEEASKSRDKKRLELQNQANKLAAQAIKNQSNFGTELYKELDVKHEIQETDALILEYAKQISKANKDGKKDLVKELDLKIQTLKSTKQNLKQIDETAKSQNNFNKTAEETLKKYKKIGDAIKSPGKFIENIGDELKKSIGERFNASLAAPKKSILEIASTGIQAGLIGGFIMAAKRAFEINDHIVEMRRQFGLTNKEAHQVHETLSDINQQTKIKGVVQEDVNKAYSQLTSTFGTIHAANQQLIDSQMLLTKHVGMTAEQATNFQETSFGTGKSVEEQLGMIRAQVTEYNQLSGDSIDVHETQKAIASVAKSTAASYGGYGPKLVQAVIQAKRLGVSLEDAEGISGNLLDIETSLENEMKANVLTGKHMNMNRARELALMGKHTEAVEEVVKQAGGYSEIMNMLPYQQEAVAAAAGMTKDQLIATTMESEKQKTLEKFKIKSLKSLTAEQRNSLITSKKYTEEQLKQMETQEQEATMKEKTAQLQSKLYSLLDKFSGPLTRMVELISKFMDKLINGIGSAKEGLKKILPEGAVKFLGDYGPKIATLGAGAFVAAKGLGKAAEFLGLKKKGDGKSPDDPMFVSVVGGGMKSGGNGGTGGGDVEAGGDAGGVGGGIMKKLKGKFTNSKLGKKLGGSKLGKFAGKAGGLLGKLGLGSMATGMISDATGIDVGGMLGGGDDVETPAPEEVKPNKPGGNSRQRRKERRAAQRAARAGGGATPSTPAPSSGGASPSAASGGGDAAKKIAESSKSGASQLSGGSTPKPSAPSAPKKGLFGSIGGFFSKVVDKAKNLAGKLNPLNAIKGAFKGPGLKKILGKIPKIGGIVNAAMSLGGAATGGGDPQEVGKQIVMAIGDMGGSFLGGILGSIIPGAGTLIGGFLGGYAGSALAGLIADNVDLSGIGKAAISMFGGDAAAAPAAAGGGGGTSASPSKPSAPSTAAGASPKPSAPSSTPTASIKPTTPTAGSTNTKTMTAASTPAARPPAAAGGGSGGSGIESLLKELITKVDQPLKINIGNKVISEIETQSALKRNITTRTDRSYNTTS
jgi:hypothetical protein